LQPFDEHKFGTVGAVALDRAGNLGAGTSTGGMTNKRFGRVGDSPIIGAGTYADNETCGVSCTGDGEYFIRAAVAHEVSSRMLYAGEPVERAAAAALEKARKLGGTGGLIALDRRGNFTMPFNTSGMYRGVVGADGRPRVSIYKD
jgi:beta-aspartyl-peptidase (threonine type)